jgi:hypothetical protein
MEIETQITTNELGQTVIHLSKSDWESYGKQAGYFPEIVKEASAEGSEDSAKDATIDSLKSEIKGLKEKIASLESVTVKKSSVGPNGGIGSNSILIREDSSFNEENYPGLIAEQQQDGLIGPFATRR